MTQLLVVQLACVRSRASRPLAIIFQELDGVSCQRPFATIYYRYCFDGEQDTSIYLHVNSKTPPLIVPFGRSAVVLLSLSSRFPTRWRGILSTDAPSYGQLGWLWAGHGLKQRRNSVKHPSIHPRQIRENGDGLFYAGQDCSTDHETVYPANYDTDAAPIASASSTDAQNVPRFSVYASQMINVLSNTETKTGGDPS